MEVGIPGRQSIKSKSTRDRKQQGILRKFPVFGIRLNIEYKAEGAEDFTLLVRGKWSQCRI